LALTFETTEYYRSPIVPRKTCQFLIEDYLHFHPGYLVSWFLGVIEGGTLLAPPPPFSCNFGVAYHALGNAIEPVGHGFLPAQRSCLLCQQQESGLKRILDVLRLP